MKHLLSSLFLAMFSLMTLSVSAEEPEEIYTVYDSKTGTLTYYKDNLRSTRSGDVLVYKADITQQRFVGYRDKITKIVIDESMAKYPNPESYAGLFFTGDVHEGLSQLVEIENMDNLHFLGGTDMSYMFYGCSALESIDFSMNTNLWTSYVKDMSYMFAKCTSLKTLDIERFETCNVEDMSYMFYNCSSLESLNLQFFRTGKVKDMSSMFDGCKALTSLNVAHFDLSNVTVISGMFTSCENLTTIYCNSDWSKLEIDADDVFVNCYKIKGDKGTVYNPEMYNHAYARPDGGASKPGYFTRVNEAYTVWDKAGKQLTYRYDQSRLTYNNTYLLPLDLLEKPEDFVDGIKTIEIEPSFKAYENEDDDIFKSDYYHPLKNVEEIKGLDNLNTSKMEYMVSMFAEMKVTVLDLTSFDVSKMRDCMAMFADCVNLTTIYCNEDWAQTSSCPSWMADNMFSGCTALVGGKGTPYASANQGIEFAHPDGEGGKPGYFTRSKQALEKVQSDKVQSTKVLRDGVLTIERGDKLFNAQGAEMR